MLAALSIYDFALIDRLELEPVAGLIGITGETGAGKSIILDALGAALGGRAERRFVRPGAKQASVFAEFSVPPNHPVWSTLDEHGFPADRGEPIGLRRVVPAQGAARGFINGQVASAGLMTEIGAILVEVHGQRATAELFRPAAHRDLLDRFAGNEALLADCAAAWAMLEAARQRRAALEARAVDARAERDWALAALEALDELAPVAGEIDRLEAARRSARGHARVQSVVAEARDRLEAADVEAVLAGAARGLSRLSAEPDLAGRVEAALAALDRAVIEVLEASAALAEIADAVDPDEADLEALEARLFALRREARKHGAAPDDLPAIAEALRVQMAADEDRDAALGAAKRAEIEAAARWRSAAEALRAARGVAAGRLEAAVAVELAPLKLGHARFRVALSDLGPDGGGPGGADRIAFEISANPGAAFSPLHQTASGGELARIALALKCALADGGGPCVVVFDEVDQGVGGAVAAAVGVRLARLAAGRQVLVVTHSPQVAAAAGAHWRIEKSVSARGRGQTSARVLNAEGREAEIARMLSGAAVTEEARAAARRLLDEGVDG